MRKLFITVISCLCLLSCREAGRNAAISTYVDSLPIWETVDVALTVRDTCGGSDNIMTVRTAWSKDSLYLFFQVDDADLRCVQREDDHPKLFLDDMVEFLFDPRNDRGEKWIEDDIIYHINLFGFKKDDRGTPEGISNPVWNGTGRYSVRVHGTINDTSDTDEGYDVEVALPWTELGVCPHDGLILGADFVCGDNDGTGRQLFDWSGAAPFRHPVQFYDFVLCCKSRL